MRPALLAACALLALLGGRAFAADMPVKAPALVAAPVWTWTGCYVGANGGFGWGRDSLSSGGADEGQPKFDGWLAGGQVGCNYQVASWVLGAEGMFDFARLTGSTVDPANPDAISSTKIDRLATLTARLGYAFDRSLIYVKGGVAWERSQRSIVQPPPFAFSQFTGHNWKAGAVVGGGFEYALTQALSVKAEFNSFYFGDIRESIVEQPGGSVFQQVDKIKSLYIATVGVNYRWFPR